MNGQWHNYVDGDGDGEHDATIHVVGFLPDALTPDGEAALCEIVVPDQRDARLLRHFLRSLDANPRGEA